MNDPRVTDKKGRLLTVHLSELRGDQRTLNLPSNAVVHGVERKWDVHRHYSWFEVTWSTTVDLPCTEGSDS